jgi:competence protein ComEC
MAIGFAKLVAGVLFPTLASALAEPLAIGEAALTRLVGVLAELPGASMDISPPPGWVIGAYYLFLLTCVLWSAGRRRTRAADAAPTRLSNAPPVHVPAAAVAGSLAIVVLSIALWMRPLPPAGRLRVTALAVGAGSASVLEMPEGQTVLFDAGTLGPQNIARHVLLPFLRLRGIARIDRTYISHANIDHFNALPELAESIPVGPIHVNRYFREHCRTRAPGRRMLSMLEGRGHELRTLDPAVRVWEYGGARFEMLSPRCASPSGNGIDCPPLTSNNASTVLRVTYAGGSILLTGDIERQTESALIAESEIHADVMVLPHHGAVNAATAPFIAAVGADVLIRSSRERMSETLNGLAALTGGSLLLNTADVGAVTVEIDADGLRVRSVHGGAHRPPTNGDDVAPAPTHSADEVPVTSSHTP